jgi:thioredoxin reductase (NADPH)
LVVDAGGGRAASIPRTHNHAGFPGGVAGKELIHRIATQARENGARIKHGRVAALGRAGGLFEARVDADTLSARTVLIATGISDRRPPMSRELHDEALAAGLIRYCPICDGYEVRDKHIAVIGTGDHGAREARFLRSFSRHVVLIAPDGKQDLSADQQAALRTTDIDVLDGPIVDLAIRGERLVCQAGSRTLQLDAAYPALGADIHSELAVSLGAAAREGGCLIIDDHARTSVPGLYAAGDVVLGLDQISGAMGQAALAATTIRNDLDAIACRIR